MKRVLFLFILLFGGESVYPQAKVDTLYYDRFGQIPKNPVFIDYYRIVLSSADSTECRTFRDFYSSGELRRDGRIETVDSLDDNRSVFAGEVISYYKNGNVSEKACYLNGRLEGECFRYREDGFLKEHANYSQGKLSGICERFCEDDGSCRVIEYKDGQPLHDYYLLSDANGNWVKYRIADDTPVWESPLVTERFVDYRDGVPREVYSKNGITISLTCSVVKDYGKWHRIDLAIFNNSRESVTFTPETDIIAYSMDDRNVATDLKVWSCDEYLKKVKRGQAWAAVGMSFAVGLSSTSTSTTTGYDSNGGYFTATTSTYNAGEAQRQRENFDRELEDEKNRKQSGYLKRNTIYPSESIYGFVHITRVKGQRVVFVINIEGAEYIYDWRFDKNGAYPIGN